MARIKVWRAPAWGNEFVQFAPRWAVDDGYRTAGADSWADAMRIARSWAGWRNG